MRPTPLAVLTIAAGLALPTGVAVASTVSVDPPGSPAVFQSGPAASDVTSQLVGGTTLQFKDAAQALTAGTGCVAGPPVSCDATNQVIHFGNGNDRFRAFSLEPITITSDGGADTIRAAGSVNTISAGGGNDSVWENGNGVGSVKGDGGNDKLYSFEAAANIQGGTGNDLLTTSSARLTNLLNGGDGDDELVATGGGEGTINGGTDDDVIVLDTPFGGWTANADGGNDIVAGSDGRDTVFSGGGSDLIDVSGDGGQDTVDCGSGADVVVYDTGDTISRNCEIRYRGSIGTIPQVQDARDDAAVFVAAMPAIPPF
jgi:Ca2+-binding RTX toxin-like protein